MVTYVITVLDHDHLEIITEADIEKYHPESNFPIDVMAAIEIVLDKRSEEQAKQ